MSHLTFVTINYGRAPLGAPPHVHSPNPHTDLLNVFIQIANNKGILKKIHWVLGNDNGASSCTPVVTKYWL
jgi:hypothetical protein